MNLYKTKLDNLIFLLDTQPEIFNQEDKSSLAALIASLPNDVEEMANRVVEWYANRDGVKNAFLDLAEHGAASLGRGKDRPPFNAQEYKEHIQNAIRQPTQPAQNPQPPTP
jgi:hypothetical protein